MIELKRTEPRVEQKAASDPRKPTRYRVLVDGHEIGEVYTRSRESWRLHGRIRTTFLGYSRTWVARTVDGVEVTSFAGTRRAAVERLTAAKSIRKADA